MNAANAQNFVGSANDFDFLEGHWHVRNQRRTDYFDPSSSWEEFEATSNVCRLPAGIGNFDEFSPIRWRPGFVGMALRIFSRQTSKWSIYWLNNNTGGINNATGELEPPVVGGFQNGVGRFVGRDTINGRAVTVQFTWSDVEKDRARWQQAFSFDEGRTWDTNWIMTFSRIDA